MKGDGEDDGLGDLLSLGSSSRSTGRRSGEREGFSGRVGGDESNLELNLAMLSSLSKDGLSMLAGGSCGGFTLKTPPVGIRSRMASLGNSATGERTGGGGGGGGFTGFYRASVPKATWPSSPAGMGSRVVNEGKEAGTSSSRRECTGNVGKPEQPLRTDVENLTPEECWKLVLKLGKRWPAWSKTTALQPPHGLMKDRSSFLEGLDHSRKDGNLGGNPGSLQLRRESFRLLTSRALEALAQTPDRYGRRAGAMRAPKLTTQQFCNTKAARDLPGCASQSAHSTLAVSRQPTLSVKLPTNSSRPMAAPTTSSARPRTAPLTIFYDGKVNVCDNVPEDKAHLIMLFAERSSINPNVQAPAPSASCAAPSTSASPHGTPGPVLAPQDSARPQEDRQPASQPSCDPVVVTVTPSVPAQLAPRTHQEDSSSHQTPVENSNPAEVAPPPMPCKVSTTEGNSQQLMQQCLNGPMSKRLPNARKNSLARFLDSRKRERPTASSSEEQPSKKQELGPPSDGLPSDANDATNSGKSPMPLCGQSSIESKEGNTAMYTNDAEMKPK